MEESGTQYDSDGTRFRHNRRGRTVPSSLTQQLLDDWRVLAPIREDTEPFSGHGYKVECLKYRNTLQNKWHTNLTNHTKRISVGISSKAYFIIVTQFINGEWVPISDVFHPDIEEGPYDIFIPPVDMDSHITSETNTADINVEADGELIDVLISALE